MAKEHKYQTTLTWTGNKGSGTMDYRSYDRSYVISIDHKNDIQGSSDSEFMGDKTRHNPEDLLVSSLSSSICYGIFIFVRKTGSLFWIIRTVPLGK